MVCEWDGPSRKNPSKSENLGLSLFGLGRTRQVYKCAPSLIVFGSIQPIGSQNLPLPSRHAPFSFPGLICRGRNQIFSSPIHRQSSAKCRRLFLLLTVHRVVNQFHVDVTSSGSTAPHYSGYNAILSIDVRYRLRNVYTRSVCSLYNSMCSCCGKGVNSQSFYAVALKDL